MIIDGIKLSGITSNSKKVREGYGFVALRGEKCDGNAYIDEAIRNGAAIVFTETDIENKEIPVKKVQDARKTLANLCNEFYNYPSEKLKIIGVTGTNGKTTTTNMIYEIIRGNGISVGLIGTLYIKINDRTYESDYTTPLAEDMYAYMSKMVEENVEVLVMEVSSHGLKTERVHGIQYDIAIHTNIERDHINFHKTFEDYIQSKKKLFDNLREGKIGIINIDDGHGLRLLEGNDNIVIVTYGLNTKATITASSLDSDQMMSFNYCLQRGITSLSGVEIEAFEYPITLPLVGKHNIYNALAAITSGLLMDIPIASIAKQVKNFNPIPRRMEIIYDKGYRIIDDFCHNPSSYEAVLETIQSMEYKNLYIVNAIRGSRGIDINKENAEVLRQWAEILKIKTLYITASRDTCGPLDEVTADERDAFIKTFSDSQIPIQYEERLQDAINKALKNLREKDMLLLLGAQGMDKGKPISLSFIEKYPQNHSETNELYNQVYKH
ncbi:Mur ligase family protein [Alkaliphilus peptidifermentans]|uniref:UDP-N-acetylmuramoylalanyl-D-glutamate--2,6-diaminopimelate ligase n=1 Tax=Alkaliphilus peptidifermentans DSM 18978 TaxID=1120976 RepID=A0A1G5K7U4_9FIRM|nr:UDP-N-acetylmuramyl-tripeptide synthetase [Alkaliphilus peptidifermentans]SCY96597.1 UDP-N-acetylmuramoylalanyl-D-glutamate--2,6-diaminopimelate ligase [Alkaliphilus peptidifermentans DSM 18978]